MASPASHSCLRFRSPLSEDARARVRVPRTFFEPPDWALPGYRSGIRDIDTRECSGSTPGDSASPRWSPGLKLQRPDHHEPTANLITLLACLLMFAAAMWWGSAQLHDHAPPKAKAAPVRDAPGAP